jgi:hypothetical protein
MRHQIDFLYLAKWETLGHPAWAQGQSVIRKTQIVAERRKTPGASLTGRLAPYRYINACELIGPAILGRSP